jgi:hypothetical protein
MKTLETLSNDAVLGWRWDAAKGDEYTYGVRMAFTLGIDCTSAQMRREVQRRLRPYLDLNIDKTTDKDWRRALQRWFRATHQEPIT